MKSYREELTFETKTRRAYINITPQVEVALRKSGIKEGLCLVNPMHISASVYINDDESGLLKDFDVFLERLVPHEPISQYRHNTPVRIMRTRTSNVRLWAEKSSSQSRTESWTSDPGNRFSTANSTGSVKRECSSS